MLSRAPAIQLADLKKGDAIMVVSTDGATEVTAITLLAALSRCSRLRQPARACSTTEHELRRGRGGSGSQ